MHYFILVLECLTAIAAFIAAYLWLKASQSKISLEHIDVADRFHDEFITLKHSLKLQGRLNAKAALWSCMAAILQGIVFLLSLFRQGL